VTDAARRSILERFANAIQMQDKTALLQLVAEKASWTSDGGGRARAALKVIRGRDHLVRFVLAVLGRHADQFAFEMTAVNGEPALALRTEDRLFSIITVRTDGVRILDVYTVLNPEKLAAPVASARD
jgi:RNA polymerase sigma-70 factor (ECF subfamily)